MPFIPDDPQKKAGFLPDQPPELEQPGILGGLKSLVVDPVVRGAKGLGELLVAGGATAGSEVARRVGKPEAATDLAQFAKNLREETGLEGSFQTPAGEYEINKEGFGTLAGAGLKTAGGIGSVVTIASLGAGGLVGIPAQAGKIIVRNALVNAGLFGTGEAAKAIREDEDISEAFYKGLTGQGTTGILEGITGDEKIARTADIALSVGLPLLLGKEIDRATNKIVSSPSNFLRRVKAGVTTPKLIGTIKQKVGDFRYKQGKDDIRAFMKAPQKIKDQAFDKGIDLEDVVIARGLDGPADETLTILNKQQEIANKELIRLAKEQGKKIVVSNTIFDDVADDLRPRATNVAEVNAINDWRKFNKAKYARTVPLPGKTVIVKEGGMDMFQALETKKNFDVASRTKGGTIKSATTAKANATVANEMRAQIKGNIDGAESLLRSQEESLLLMPVFKRIITSKKGTTLKDSIGRLFNPITFGKETFGVAAEKLGGGQKFGFRVAGELPETPPGL